MIFIGGYAVVVVPVCLLLSLQVRVLIVGAGTAGIAAANHLRNYGHSVNISFHHIPVITSSDQWSSLCLLRSIYWRPRAVSGVV